LTYRYVCDYTEYCVNPWIAWPYVRYIWLVTPIAHMCSIWLVVLVAANRYWAVCRPHDAGRVWTTRRTVGYVTAVVVGVVAFNVPRMVEYRIETVPVASIGFNTSIASPANTAASPVDVFHDGGGSTTHIETETETAWKLREVTTEFGRSSFYRYVYKVLFVNILLVLLPLVTLIVLSVFVIRALRQTPSYRLSLLHTQPARLSEKHVVLRAPSPLAGDVADLANDEVVKVDDVIVDDEDEQRQQQQQQQQLMSDEPANIREECGNNDTTATKSRLRFSLKSLKVRHLSSSVVLIVQCSY